MNTPLPRDHRYSVTPEGQIIGVRGHALKEPRDTHGYPTVYVAGRMIGVHILVAEALIGPRPHGAEIRHLDGNKENHHPSNLAYGTRSDNRRDRVRHGMDWNANKTHCINGHEYTPENTYVYTGRGKKERQCRKCMSAAQKLFKQRKPKPMKHGNAPYAAIGSPS